MPDSEDNEPADLGTDLDDAIEKSRIPPENLQKLVEALKQVPYLESVELCVDEANAGRVGVNADYVVDSQKMPGVLYSGMMNLLGSEKIPPIDLLRAARRVFASIQGATKYEFDNIKADTETGVFTASVQLERAGVQPDSALHEKVCVYLEQKK